MTVKPKKRGRPAKGAQSLSQQVIIDKAKQLMQLQGKVPSIRQLATDLSIDAMAIYYYFKNKDELLEAIGVSLVEGIYVPGTLNDWREEIAELGWSYLNLLGQYPGLLETLMKMKTTGPAEVFISRFNQVIAGVGLDTSEAGHAVNLLADYLHGFAFAMQFSDVDKETKRAIYNGSISLYMKAIQPELSSCSASE